MEIHLLYIFALLTLVQLVATHAALPPETYWNSMLPNTPMPKAISDALHPDMKKDKSTSVGVGKGGVNVDAGKGKPGGAEVNSSKIDLLPPLPGLPLPPLPGLPLLPPLPISPVFTTYSNAATENQLHDDPNVALIFLEKDLHPATIMNLHFTQNPNQATFLPRQVSKSIPFSSSKLPEILNRFSVKLGPAEADMMKNTIEECEKPGNRGEEKYCATSLESMVDFSTSKLGKHVQVISTEVGKETNIMKKYTVGPGVKKMSGDKSVVCHKLNYPYAVFYCHSTDTIRAYMVPLEGADGTKAKAVAVCHTDTSAWNPKHLAFQVLKVKPGTPVCHFLPEDHVVWVQN